MDEQIAEYIDEFYMQFIADQTTKPPHEREWDRETQIAYLTNYLSSKGTFNEEEIEQFYENSLETRLTLDVKPQNHPRRKALYREYMSGFPKTKRWLTVSLAALTITALSFFAHNSNVEKEVENQLIEMQYVQEHAPEHTRQIKDRGRAINLPATQQRQLEQLADQAQEHAIQTETATTQYGNTPRQIQDQVTVLNVYIPFKDTGVEQQIQNERQHLRQYTSKMHRAEGILEEQEVLTAQTKILETEYVRMRNRETPHIQEITDAIDEVYFYGRESIERRDTTGLKAANVRLVDYQYSVAVLEEIIQDIQNLRQLSMDQHARAYLRNIEETSIEEAIEGHRKELELGWRQVSYVAAALAKECTLVSKNTFEERPESMFGRKYFITECLDRNNNPVTMFIDAHDPGDSRTHETYLEPVDEWLVRVRKREIDEIYDDAQSRNPWYDIIGKKERGNLLPTYIKRQQSMPSPSDYPNLILQPHEGEIITKFEEVY